MARITFRVERTVRDESRSRRGSWRVRGLAVMAGAVAIAGSTLLGMSTADAGVKTINPVTLASSVSVASNGTVQLVVLGGASTVPTDARQVVFDATVTNPTANGNLRAYPNLFPAEAVGTLHFTTGNTAEGSFTERPGVKSEVDFHNSSTGTITLTVKVTGYTTDVDASDITSTGGSAGQVLTNTGSGAAWAPVGHAYGVGNPFNVVGLNTGLTTVASVTVPAGSYVVNFATTIAGSTSSTPDNVGCYLFSPASAELLAAYGNTYATDDQSVIAGQGLVSNTSGGTITLQCVDSNSTASAFYPTLIANSVGAVDGYSGNARPHGAQSRSTGHFGPTPH